MFEVGDKTVVTNPYRGILYELNLGDMGTVVEVYSKNEYIVEFTKYPKERLEMNINEMRLATPLENLL